MQVTMVLGAVFAQIQSDGTEKPVASRTLTDAEKKYSIVEKEALACVWATEKWRNLLVGHRFTLRTDHQALTTLLTQKEWEEPEYGLLAGQHVCFVLITTLSIGLVP